MVDRFYTTEQVADALQVSPDTVLRLAGRGDLPSHRVGRSRRYAEADVLAYLAAHRDGAPHGGQSASVIPIKRGHR